MVGLLKGSEITRFALPAPDSIKPSQTSIFGSQPSADLPDKPSSTPPQAPPPVVVSDLPRPGQTALEGASLDVGNSAAPGPHSFLSSEGIGHQLPVLHAAGHATAAVASSNPSPEQEERTSSPAVPAAVPHTAAAAAEHGPSAEIAHAQSPPFNASVPTHAGAPTAAAAAPPSSQASPHEGVASSPSNLLPPPATAAVSRHAHMLADNLQQPRGPVPADAQHSLLSRPQPAASRSSPEGADVAAAPIDAVDAAALNPLSSGVASSQPSSATASSPNEPLLERPSQSDFKALATGQQSFSELQSQGSSNGSQAADLAANQDVTLNAPHHRVDSFTSQQGGDRDRRTSPSPHALSSPASLNQQGRHGAVGASESASESADGRQPPPAVPSDPSINTAAAAHRQPLGTLPTPQPSQNAEDGVSTLRGDAGEPSRANPAVHDSPAASQQLGQASSSSSGPPQAGAHQSVSEIPGRAQGPGVSRPAASPAQPARVGMRQTQPALANDLDRLRNPFGLRPSGQTVLQEQAPPPRQPSRSSADASTAQQAPPPSQPDPPPSVSNNAQQPVRSSAAAPAGSQKDGPKPSRPQDGAAAASDAEHLRRLRDPFGRMLSASHTAADRSPGSSTLQRQPPREGLGSSTQLGQPTQTADATSELQRDKTSRSLLGGAMQPDNASQAGNGSNPLGHNVGLQEGPLDSVERTALKPYGTPPEHVSRSRSSTTSTQQRKSAPSKPGSAPSGHLERSLTDFNPLG